MTPDDESNGDDILPAVLQREALALSGINARNDVAA